jgi:hypothetical protein
MPICVCFPPPPPKKKKLTNGRIFQDVKYEHGGDAESFTSIPVINEPWHLVM